MDKQTEVREILEGISSGGLSVDEGLRELGIVGVVIRGDYTVTYSVPIQAGTELVLVKPLIKGV